MKFITKISLSLIIVETFGIIASVPLTLSIAEWDLALDKPISSTNLLIFTVVWTVMYVLISMGWYLTWKDGFKNFASKAGSVILIIQLLLNIGWSFSFYQQQDLISAMSCSVILWIVTALLTYYFYRANTSAGNFMLPYLFWVSYAFVLTLSMWQIN